MQTIIFMAIFAMFFSVVASVISMGTVSSATIKAEAIAKTQQYLSNMAQVINDQITSQYFTANPGGKNTLDDYVRSRPELTALTISRNGDTFADAWSRPIKGDWVKDEKQFLLNDPTNQVRVPVTAFLLVSMGPDGILQTKIPALKNVSDVYGVRPEGDDILTAFDNRGAQTQLLNTIQSRINRIVAASVKNLEGRLNARQQALLREYKTQVENGLSPSLDMIDLKNDTPLKTKIAAKQLFYDLDKEEDCQPIGVEEECDKLLNTPAPDTFSMNSDTTQTSMDPMTIHVEVANGNDTFPWKLKIQAIADIDAATVVPN
jgi:hypothetical protein